MDPSREAVPGAPWYRLRPGAAFATALAMFTGVLIAEALDTGAADAIALLYSLPIALMAVTFGLRGGLVAAASGYVAFTAFAIAGPHGYVGVEGWLTRAAAMFLLGGLLGHATDRSERATAAALYQERRRLLAEEQSRRYNEGLEISDSILQFVAAARWRIEQGRHEEAAALLASALDRGQRMVGELLPERISDATPADQPSPPVERWLPLEGLACDLEINPGLEES